MACDACRTWTQLQTSPLAKLLVRGRFDAFFGYPRMNVDLQEQVACHRNLRSRPETSRVTALQGLSRGSELPVREGCRGLRIGIGPNDIDPLRAQRGAQVAYFQDNPTHRKYFPRQLCKALMQWNVNGTRVAFIGRYLATFGTPTGQTN
jgi:hypothetical protein